MPGQEIADEILAAFREVAMETGNGELTGILTRHNPPNENVYPVVPGGTSQHTFTFLYDEFNPAEMASGLVTRHDMKISIAAASLAIRPREDDEVTISEGTFTIYWVEPTQPGGVPFWYDVQIRKS